MLQVSGRKYNGVAYIHLSFLTTVSTFCPTSKGCVPFVKSVVKAIQELHRFNTAHLDIRLENICFNTAILIDIDRSCSKTDHASHLYLRFSRSEMYKCESDTWTLRLEAIGIAYLDNDT